MEGQTISHYKVLSEVGRGGMGVVYKAEDTNLKRPVALKFLAAHLLDDKEIKTRFHREAEAAAAPNHPNVCTVHEIAEDNGRTFIAMAFLEGEPLEKKIEAGPLKLKDALDITIQTAKGLQAAHGKKIVHRDIKPANLMIGEDGHVTIMDFGLALLADRSKLTRLDETMGTVTYMSPEQTYGMELDHRTDVWSLGVVIYEMVTGQRPFKGHYDQAVTYSITSEEPEPMTALRTGVPMELEWLVGKCLAKEADKRYQSTADMVVDLEALSEKLKSGKSTILRTSAPVGIDTPAGPALSEAAGPVISATAVAPDAAPSQAEPTQPAATLLSLPHQRTALLVALILALSAITVLSFRAPEEPQQKLAVKFAFTPDSFSGVARGRTAISPNGRHIAYVSGDQPTKLWVRDLDNEESRELDDTEGAQWSLFWSPDSQFIGFATSQELKKISVQGGPAVTLCQLPGTIYSGSTWSPDGELIVLGSINPSGLYKIPSQGGNPELLFEPARSEKGVGYNHPHFLPLEASALSIVHDWGSRESRDIVLRNLETGEWSVLAEGSSAVYSPTGHILYQTSPFSGDLWALPFSIETLKTTGAPFPVAENAGEASAAEDGTLIYVDSIGGAQQLVWRDRDGNKLGVIGRPQREIVSPALSPDGRRVAVRGSEGGNTDIWVHEVDRPLKRRLTFHPRVEADPIWSADSKLTFRSQRNGNNDIFSRDPDGAGDPALLVGTALEERPTDWSADGSYLVYSVRDPTSLDDLWILKRKDAGGTFEPEPFLQTRFSEIRGSLSPDGRFLAYSSNESGQFEVYVQPFPAGGPTSQVSTNGGGHPRWNKDGKGLFYVEGDTLIRVAVSTTPSFSVGSMAPLFSHSSFGIGVNARPYDVSADGQRFVLVEPVEDDEAKPPAIHIVQNWFEEFRDHE